MFLIKIFNKHLSNKQSSSCAIYLNADFTIQQLVFSVGN